ncbi:heavy metal transport/detoxification protein [Exiguobacterium indicum]|uniref:cation transporter n=1 Tax=Exiguobacterium TaxID=33986 RepID=UPI000419DE6D|nr:MULTISPECIES: cation transporter [Exiguobacterium]KNH36964.1 heavy metal transport/detoxification protein [Exiguobacterium acetylicum]KTR60899.1 heavy metal transport/detoxification protein [Exiguobacterium indicum]MBF8154627.1 heavy-metal-associated domain-containing protein [Exiguobacterium sp. TBG-PICH-001]NTY08225.1 heavy-metal-associated domain-containing protein [Exiguobacterium sp. JMULE1]OAI85135.1 heavy metal transport/detoxification protein [Exiguobacterium sp. KKBO11]
MKETTLSVIGMTCNHCKASVESALSEVEGVQQATVSLEQNQVTVQHEDVPRERLVDAIEEIGYDVPTA